VPATSTETTLDELARAKLAKVLGPERGAASLASALESTGLSSIETPEQLYAVSLALTAMGGITGAVGAMLGVAAIMRGATGRPPDTR